MRRLPHELRDLVKACSRADLTGWEKRIGGAEAPECVLSHGLVLLIPVHIPRVPAGKPRRIDGQQPGFRKLQHFPDVVRVREPCRTSGDLPTAGSVNGIRGVNFIRVEFCEHRRQMATERQWLR